MTREEAAHFIAYRLCNQDSVPAGPSQIESALLALTAPSDPKERRRGERRKRFATCSCGRGVTPCPGDQRGTVATDRRKAKAWTEETLAEALWREWPKPTAERLHDCSFINESIGVISRFKRLARLALAGPK